MTWQHELTLEVRGTPITQGSKDTFRTSRGKTIVRESGGRKLDFWRNALGSDARDTWGDRPLLDGPVCMRLDFTLQRPKSHGKKTTWPVGAHSGDVDKLARAALDAITGVVIGDDSQVIDLRVTKAWGNPGVVVRLGHLVPEGAP